MVQNERIQPGTVDLIHLGPSCLCLVEREVVVDGPPGPCPDTGGARCAVCSADFPGTRSVVEHLVAEHGIRIRPPLLLAARRLQVAGYFLPGV